MKNGPTVCVGGERFGNSSLRNLQRDLLWRLPAIQLHPPCNLILSAARQLYGIVLQEDCRHLDQHHVTGNSTVAPPVELQRGNGVCAADVAHLDDQKILAVSQKRSCLEIERCESAFVFPQLFAVQVNGSLIVGSAEVNKHTRIRALVITELAPVPDRAFIEHQLLALGVPVSRNVQNGRCVETVLDAIALVAGLFIAKESSRLAVFERVHNSSPCAVEAYRRTAGYVCNQRGCSRRSMDPSRQQEHK